VTPPPGARLAGRLSIDAGRVAESLRIGVESMAAVLSDEPARLLPAPSAALVPLWPAPGYASE
jgi:hypothetical protein